MVDQSGPHLLAALEALDGRIGRGLGRRLVASGIRVRGSEGRILDLVQPGGSRPTDLASGAWITKQAVSKRIRDLEARGLVRTTPDPVDARALLVHLTANGERVRDLIEAHIADLERELAEQVGPRRYRQFRQVLADLTGPEPDGPPS